MAEKLEKLPFTSLQETISWNSSSDTHEIGFDEGSDAYEIGFDEESIGYFDNRLKELKIPPAERAIFKKQVPAKKGFSDSYVDDKVKHMFYSSLHLERIAALSGLYEKGVFGVSFINVGNVPDKIDSYGHSRPHLRLGSLNIPSKDLGKDTVWSTRQYFYFGLARDDSKTGAVATKKDKIRIPSEVLQLFSACELTNPRPGDTFLNRFEMASKCLLVRYEYLMLYLFKHLEDLQERTKLQLNRLENEIQNMYKDCLLYTSPSPRD